MSEPLPRPRQVTLAGGLIMAGSVFLVIAAFDRVAGLTSLESQESLRSLLDEPPGDGLGLGLESLESIVRVLCLIAAGAATAAAILGFQVLQRSRSARLVLSLLAPFLVIAGAAVTAFLGSLVAAGIVMLWLQPARSWFRGEPLPAPAGRPDAASNPFLPPATSTEPPPPQAREQSEAPPAQALPPAPQAPESSAGPRPMVGFGSAEVRPHLPLNARVGAPDGPPGQRPRAVLWACVLTWVCSGLAIALLLLSVLVMLVIPDVVFEELRRQDPGFAEEGFTDARIRTATYVLAGIFVPWCLGAIAAAVFVFRGAGWARRVLLGSSGGAAAFCLLGAVGNIALALPLAACVATVVLLLRGDVRLWFR